MLCVFPESFIVDISLVKTRKNKPYKLLKKAQFTSIKE
jgi:hypothetical protein